MSRRFLVTGAAGQVGTELRRLGGERVVAVGRDELDIADGAAVVAMLEREHLACVINAAAYTAVDRAEQEVAASWRVNALGPAILAAETSRRGLPLIHLSTDYVFDGSKPLPYDEDDAVAPIGVYGASKEGGEQAVRTANPRHITLRTAWVVSPHGHNFVKTMLRLAAERELVRVVNDQMGCPTSAADIARGCLTLAERLANDAAAPTGTYQLVNTGEASWCGFARAIFDRWAARGHKVPRLEPITTADYPTPARRPANSRLSTAKLARTFGIVPRPWGEALDEILDELERE